MNTLYIGLVMAIFFVVIMVSQIFTLQKEVRKLKSITSFLMKEIKNKKVNK
tara:strand:- start:968 stop:1120 length:153 start_codon:yes stop_codon:yes gene_type:complete